MDKYLIEILKEINTIIIPDLGALTIVNAATHEVMFMPYLKYDDGKLAQYIAEKEGWSENDAKNLIAKYVREINTKLDQGESYDMYNFGSFYKSEEGDIEFKSWEFDPLKEAIETPPVIAIPEEDTKVEDSIIETEPEEIEATVEEKVEEAQPTIEADAPVLETIEEVAVQHEETIEEARQEVFVSIEELAEDLKEDLEESNDHSMLETPIIESSETQMISEEEQWADDLDVPPVNFQKEVKKQPILEKTQKDKKRKKKKKQEEEKHSNGGVYAFFGISAVVIAGAIYLYLNQDKYFSKTPIAQHTIHEEHSEDQTANDENADAVTQLNEDLTSEETNTPIQEEAVSEKIPEVEIKEEPVKEAPKVTQPIVSSNGITIDKSLPVQVIVGSFSEEANAESKVASLKSNGFDAAVIGRYNGLHFVSIGSFNSMSEFNQNKQAINAVASNYWVFKK